MNIDFNNITPAIVVVCYIFAELSKKTFLKTDEKRKMIPLYCAILGIACSVLTFVFFPDAINALNIVEAIANGGFSGLAATGCNQLLKKLKNNNSDINDDSFNENI